LRGFSLAEIFGFIYRKEGEEGLQQLLAMFDDLTFETLQDAASELQAAGLSKPAAVLAELAAETPSELDSGNPYEEADRLNWSSWRNSWLRRREMRSGKIEASLRAQKSLKHRQTQHTRH
jgi:hypothetical protein